MKKFRQIKETDTYHESAALVEVIRIENAIRIASSNNKENNFCFLLISDEYDKKLFILLTKVSLGFREANLIRNIVYKRKFFSRYLNRIFKVFTFKEVSDIEIDRYVKDMCVMLFMGEYDMSDGRWMAHIGALSRGNDFVQVFFDYGNEGRYFHACEEYFEDERKDGIPIFDWNIYDFGYKFGLHTCPYCGGLVLLLKRDEEKWQEIKKMMVELNRKKVKERK